MLSGCSWLSVSALGSAPLPALRLLDLRWIEDVKDSQLRELLLPPPDTKPGAASVGSFVERVGQGGVLRPMRGVKGFEETIEYLSLKRKALLGRCLFTHLLCAGPCDRSRGIKMKRM